MKHCNLCQTPIKEYQLTKKVSHSQNATAIGGSGLMGMFMGMALGLGRNSIKDSHLGCYKWFWKHQIWFAIASIILLIAGFILLIFGPVISVALGVKDVLDDPSGDVPEVMSILQFAIIGIVLIVVSWIVMFSGNLYSRSKTKDGKHKDDFIDEEVYRIYKSRVKQADEILADGAPIADISKSAYLQDLKFDNDKESYTVSKEEQPNMVSGKDKVKDELEAAQAKIKEQEELLKKLQKDKE